MNIEQLEEEITCTCGAGHGSLEGHMPWCDWTESNVAVEPTMTREQKLEQAIEKLLACPAIADGNHSEPAWGCKETAEAEAFARAALEAAQGGEG